MEESCLLITIPLEIYLSINAVSEFGLFKVCFGNLRFFFQDVPLYLQWLHML